MAVHLRDFIRRKALFLHDTVLKSAGIRQDYRHFLPCLTQKYPLYRCEQFCSRSLNKGNSYGDQLFFCSLTPLFCKTGSIPKLHRLRAGFTR